MTENGTEKPSTLPPVDTIIYRNVSIHGEIAEFWTEAETPEPTEKGALMFRACGGGWCGKWVLGKRGVVCFLATTMPEKDYLGYKVVGHGKKGNCVFVEPVYGDSTKLLAYALSCVADSSKMGKFESCL